MVLNACGLQVKDTATFRFDLRKGAAAPQLHRVPAPEAAAWQSVRGLTEEAVLQKIKKMVGPRPRLRSW